LFLQACLQCIDCNAWTDNKFNRNNLEKLMVRFKELCALCSIFLTVRVLRHPGLDRSAGQSFSFFLASKQHLLTGSDLMEPGRHYSAACAGSSTIVQKHICFPFHFGKRIIPGFFPREPQDSRYRKKELPLWTWPGSDPFSRHMQAPLKQGPWPVPAACALQRTALYPC